MANNSEIFNFIIDNNSYAQLTHIGDSVVSTHSSEKLKGDGYYGRSDGLHTVQYNLDGFIGNLTVQGTLASNPSNVDWFNISISNHESISTDSDNATGSFIYNFTGNFVYVRILVSSWTDGNIRSVILNH